MIGVLLIIIAFVLQCFAIFFGAVCGTFVLQEDRRATVVSLSCAVALAIAASALMIAAGGV
ncbi:hypothetical protein [Pseudotabrizicola algicola]|uniref:Uncharacterized protein n=1 Tax=Pseudotabrizicola algicola TaxID=2709381 RepID=A0A6B3RNH0_9RHOB|nr:hypothetical protein [Pseudotabrizicola algicola]NEX47627.1 hypothetical protein [Pseudotabrizicola algicola]